jgi:AcrR family transcriptional regulator
MTTERSLGKLQCNVDHVPRQVIALQRFFHAKAREIERNAVNVAQHPQVQDMEIANWRDFGKAELGPILSGALGCFMENGYHGTTIRKIADSSGLSVPGVYHHFSSKHSILDELDRTAMHELWVRSQAALDDGPRDVLSRFDRLIECLVLFHAYRREVAFISFSEIRSLEGAARLEHLSARSRQQKLLTDLVLEGCDSGIFVNEFPREAARAITNICVGVSQWYRDTGELTPRELAKRYVSLCRKTVGANQQCECA